MQALLSNPRYVAGTLAYGFARKVAQLHDARVPRGADRHAPMLLRDKLLVAAIGTLSAPYWWPIYAYLDLGRAERKLRGEPGDPTPPLPICYVF